MKTFNNSLAFKVVTCLGILILLNLGNWQLYRLQWKKSLIAMLQSRAQLPPLVEQELTQLSPNQIKQFEFRSLKVEGIYLHNLEFKLLGRTYRGQAGYHIITPFLLKNKKILLVDRGWIPTVENNFSKPLGTFSIKGYIRLNSEKNFFTPENNFASHELYSINPAEIKTKTQIENLFPFYLCLSESDLKAFPISVPLGINLRNFHLIYALTWYSLALGLALIYFLSHRKNYKKKQS